MLADPRAAIGYLSQLKSAITKSDPDYPEVLAHLGAAKVTLAIRTGQAEDAQAALDALQEALSAAPADLDERHLLLSNLGVAWQLLFSSTGELSALLEAIEFTKGAIAATPSGDPRVMGLTANLGMCLHILASRTGRIEDAQAAVEVGRRAVAAIGPDTPDPAPALSSLSVALRLLYNRTGQTSLLREATDVGRRAVSAASESERPSVQGNLAGVLRAFGERTGQVSVVEEAVATGREAIATLPDGHAHRVLFLANLAFALKNLFDLTDRIEALAESAAIGRQVVQALPASHPGRPLAMSNLAGTLAVLGERTTRADVLREAVSVARQAVAATPADHGDRAVRLANLADALGRLGQTGEAGALEEAVKVARDAVAIAVAAGDPNRGMYLTNLGAMLQQLYEHTEHVTVLLDAVTASRRAVKDTPPDHPNWAGYQFNLGSLLARLSQCVGYEAVGEDAADCLAAAAECGAAPARLRVRAYRAWAALPPGPSRPPQRVLEAIEAAVELLPLAVSRQLPSLDRAYGAALLAGLPAQAAAAAVNAGRPDRAVELLEQTRGLVVADVLEARSSDIGRLRDHEPALTRELDDLRLHIRALDQAAEDRSATWQSQPPAGTGAWNEALPVETLAAARRQAAADWDSLIFRIRARPELADFLRLDQISRLAQAAASGPIVYVYSDTTRCDALILRAGRKNPVTLVPLTPLSQDLAATQTSRFTDAIDAIRNSGTGKDAAQAREVMLEVLAWLWDTVASPVIAALDDEGENEAGPPEPRQVWWCPVGFFAYLPFHAAGHHNDSDRTTRRAVLDNVISSYTPTARALEYARNHPNHASDQTLIISAPGNPPLPYGPEEARKLSSLVPNARTLLNPTPGEVLETLPRQAVAHFCCHGIADLTDPAASRLLLRANTPLTVADINALHLTGAQLAYLSACETTVTTFNLADEAIHITAAFHLTGYQHVIGTLWAVNDWAAYTLAISTYRQLTADGKTAPQTTQTALALHHAVRTLRENTRSRPEIWASHIHVGC